MPTFRNTLSVPSSKAGAFEDGTDRVFRNVGIYKSDAGESPKRKQTRFQWIFGTIRKHLKKTHTNTEMKFYKVVARPTLLYGSDIWVTTKRDMTRLEAAEMHFLRSVKGYTRLEKIRSELIRKELEISGIQDVRAKYKQNWINHLERMDNTRLPKHALNYKPRGRRDGGRPRKRWQRVDARTCQST